MNNINMNNNSMNTTDKSGVSLQGSISGEVTIDNMTTICGESSSLEISHLYNISTKEVDDVISEVYNDYVLLRTHLVQFKSDKGDFYTIASRLALEVILGRLGLPFNWEEPKVIDNTGFPF